MELVGEQLIAAPRSRVWAALHDPAILRHCIPGCEDVTRLSETVYEARVLTRVGPLKARFSGRVEMTEIDEPSACTLLFEGGAGSVGMAQGQARVRLSEASEGTHLSYAADAAIGGKLGQIGGRLVEASARKIADDFFQSLNAQLEPAASTTSIPRNEATQGQPSSAPVTPTAVAATSRMPVHAAVFAPGWSGELQRLLWVAVGLLAGIGLAHLIHV